MVSSLPGSPCLILTKTGESLDFVSSPLNHKVSGHEKLGSKRGMVSNLTQISRSKLRKMVDEKALNLCPLVVEEGREEDNISWFLRREKKEKGIMR